MASASLVTWFTDAFRYLHWSQAAGGEAAGSDEKYISGCEKHEVTSALTHVVKVLGQGNSRLFCQFDKRLRV